MSDGKLIFDTSIDTKGFESDLKSLDSKVNSGGFSVGSGLKSILGADIIRQAAKELFDFGVTSVTTASQLENIQTRVDDVFTSNADAVREYGKTAKENLGMAESAYLQYASIFGTYFKNAGASEEEIFKWSTDLVSRGGDLATYWGTSTDEALGKIYSALKGETEAINDFGVDIRVAALGNFTGTDMTGADQLSQLTAIYGKIMQDTQDQEGTFLDRQSNFVAQQQIFAANIQQTQAALGNLLLPVATDVLTAINGIFDPQVEITVTDKLSEVVEGFEAFNTSLEESEKSFAASEASIESRASLANEYLTTLETMQTNGINTDADVMAVKNAITALQTLYPELGNVLPKLEDIYSGSTSLAKLNTEAIRNNISAMQDMALQNLFMEQWESNAAQMAEAQSKLAEAQIALEGASQPLADIETQIAGVQQLYDELLSGGFAGVGAYAGKFADLIPSFDQYFQRNEDGSWSAINQANIDPTVLSSDAQNALAKLNAERNGILEGIAEAQTAVDSYNQAIADITADQADIVQQQAKIKENMNAAGSEAAEAAAEGVSGNASAIGDAVADATSDAAANVDIAAAFRAGVSYVTAFINGLKSKSIPTLNAKTSVSGSGVDGSHASGLNYVPYNGYIAQLHVGESVLNARDAQKWRSGEGSPAAAPAVPMASAKPEVNVYIDGEKVSKVQKRSNSTQLALDNIRIAKGVGSR